MIRLQLFRPSVARLSRHVASKRTFSRLPLVINDEIQDALNRKMPVVALESTIITHGLPYPENLTMAREVEAVIRGQGAIPATMAFVDGKPIVGVGEQQLQRLAESKDLVKVSRRDIGHVMSRKLTGGTTIASTMILAHRAGIKVFATGGLGGVHRGCETTMDISADLDELGRTPVGVVCSGPKSILDIPKTMEYLETKGVYVSTYGSRKTNIPGFFTADSGVPHCGSLRIIAEPNQSPYNFSTPEEAAETLSNSMELNSGSVFCIPTPSHLSMPKDFIDKIIHDALTQAEREGITGKQVTPYLLNKIWIETKGDSLRTNVGFVKNNAAIGAQIAVHLASLEAKYKNLERFIEPSEKPEPSLAKKSPLTEQEIKKMSTALSNLDSSLSTGSQIGIEESTVVDEEEPYKMPYGVVVGALAEDVVCYIGDETSTANLLHTSHPGSVKTALGGVAYNIARAATFLGPGQIMLISLGSEELIQTLAKEGMDTRGIIKSDRLPARYVAIHDAGGELVTAVADMSIIHSMSTQELYCKLTSVYVAALFFDGNLSTGQMETILDYVRDFRPIVGFEPTSVPKARRLAELPLRVYPLHDISVASPNRLELASMFEAFSDAGKFDVDEWFPVIDDLNIGQDFRSSMEDLARATADLADIVSSGTVQQAVHLLPYISTLLVKNGSKGVTLFQLIEDAPVYKFNLQRHPSKFTKIWTGRHERGILVHHVPAQEIGPDNVVNVSGAGDTFFGVILSETVNNPDLFYDPTVKDMSKVLERAQRAARLTIQSDQPVSPAIRNI